MRLSRWLSIPTLALAFLGVSPVFADAEKKPIPKEQLSFGTLRSLSAEDARNQAQAWLKGAHNDEATQKAFDAIWSQDSRPILDRVADTLSLGDAEAKKILTDARDTSKSAPTEVPAYILDTKVPAFVRANLALAYARTLTNRRVYEEALASLKTTKVEQVCEPGTYLFLRSVTEYSLMQPKDAVTSINRLLDDAIDAPERYRMVAALMHLDMLTWRDKDLGSIARKMDNIERRLDLDRGGPTTQKMQKEVVMRLDELIKEKENQQKKKGGS